MTADLPKAKLVREGEALYEGIPYRVDIFEVYLKPGTGDADDPPEIARDQEGVFYEIRMMPPNENTYKAGGGVSDTLEEAERQAEKKTGGVLWKRPITPS